MFARDKIIAEANVFITARERGKLVPDMCREGHNIWVNIGREYLPKVISPLFGGSRCKDDSYVKWVGFGIGGDQQLVDIAATYPTLDTHYPGQNLFTGLDLTTSYLERPVKISGTAGVGSRAGVWMNTITIDGTHPAYSGTPASTVEYEALFSATDINFVDGSYPAVPLSEVGLFLSSQTVSHTSENVYDYGTPPAYVNAATRSILIAYHPFPTITKTSGVLLEVRWQLQF